MLEVIFVLRAVHGSYLPWKGPLLGTDSIQDAHIRLSLNNFKFPISCNTQSFLHFIACIFYYFYASYVPQLLPFWSLLPLCVPTFLTLILTPFYSYNNLGHDAFLSLGLYCRTTNPLSEAQCVPPHISNVEALVPKLTVFGSVFFFNLWFLLHLYLYTLVVQRSFIEIFPYMHLMNPDQIHTLSLLVPPSPPS
jgi:hypothetical protein